MSVLFLDNEKLMYYTTPQEPAELWRGGIQKCRKVSYMTLLLRDKASVHLSLDKFWSPCE